MRRLASALWVVVLLAGCGGDDGGGGTRVSAGGISFEIPEGWSVEQNGDRGLVATEGEGIVTAGAAPEAEALDAILDSVEASGGLEVGGQPEEIDIDGRPGVAITLEEGSVTRRIATASSEGGTAYQVVLEAPTDDWDEVEDEFEDILDSVEFTGDDLAAPEPPAEPKRPSQPVEPEELEDGPEPPPAEPPGDGDAGPSSIFDPNAATAATQLAVDTYGMRPSEPVLDEYQSELDPTWAVVTFSAGGRNIAAWLLQAACPSSPGQCWYAMTSTEGGAEEAGGVGVPEDIRRPAFG